MLASEPALQSEESKRILGDVQIEQPSSILRLVHLGSIQHNWTQVDLVKDIRARIKDPSDDRRSRIESRTIVRDQSSR